MRDWLTILIVILIVGIVLDALRRMRATRTANIRLSKNAKKADKELEPPVPPSEFPASRARVVSQRDEDMAQSVTENLKQSFESTKVTKGAPKLVSRAEALDLDEHVPLLMDTVETLSDEDDLVEDSLSPADTNLGESDLGENNLGESNLAAIDTDALLGDFNTSHREPSLGGMEDLNEPVNDAHLQPTSEASVDTPSMEPVSKMELEPVSKPKARDTQSVDASASGGNILGEPQDVIVVNVMAQSSARFNGHDLIQAFSQAGLKLGAMDIFHRHFDDNDDTPVLFSLANMVVPGTFKLSELDSFETPGVSLFLTLPIASDSVAAFDNMMDTAQYLADCLGGDLKDENRCLMTRQTIEYARQRVVEFERRRHLESAEA